MTTIYKSTDPELQLKLRLWPATRLVDLYKDYQCRYDAQPDLPAGKWHNPVLEKFELAYWVARDRDHEAGRRHEVLAGLCAIMCPHPNPLESEYSYGARQYELDVPALLLTGELAMPEHRMAQPAPNRTYEDILSEKRLQEEFVNDEAYMNTVLRRPEKYRAFVATPTQQ